MKKLLLFTLLLLVALLFASCEQDNKPNSDAGNQEPAGHDHSFSLGWISDSGEHWKACTVEGCTERAEIALHTYGEGTVTEPAASGKEGKMTYTCAVCGSTKNEPIPALPEKMPVEDWEALFTYENVRIDYKVEGDDSEYYYLVNGDTVVSVMGEEKFYEDRSSLVEVDFSASYEQFELLATGEYFASAVSVDYMEFMQVTLSDVTVYLDNGVVEKITYSMDFGTLGKVSYVYTFSLWGEIDALAPDNTLTEQMLAYALADERFYNFTFESDLNHYLFDGNDYMEIFYDEDYNMSGSAVASSETFKWNVIDPIIHLISGIDVSCFEYSQAFEVYVCTLDIEGVSELSFALDEEGNLSYVSIVDADEEIHMYWFYDYGATVLEEII